MIALSLFGLKVISACVPSGARRPFNTRSANTASGCWQGNPCPYDSYSFNSGQGLNFQALGQLVSCTAGTPVCVSNVAIATYGGSTVCQGGFTVQCDGVAVGTINTMSSTCTAGSAMSNGVGPCRISFSARTCTTITLVASVNNFAGGCCGGSSPDTMLTAVSVW
jgi:hypothetical protein